MRNKYSPDSCKGPKLQTHVTYTKGCLTIRYGLRLSVISSWKVYFSLLNEFCHLFWFISYFSSSLPAVGFLTYLVSKLCLPTNLSLYHAILSSRSSFPVFNSKVTARLSPDLNLLLFNVIILLQNNLLYIYFTWLSFIPLTHFLIPYPINLSHHVSIPLNV